MPDAIKLEITIPAHIVALRFDGWSAGAMRAQGFKLPDTIPDCAVLRDGAFEHVQLSFTIAPEAKP